MVNWSICPCWFAGSTCDDEKVPTRIDIYKIIVTKFPAGNGTDPLDLPMAGTNADLKVIVYKECSPGPWCSMFTSDVKNNALSGTSYTFQLPATSLAKPLDNYRVSLYDEDFANDMFMGGKTFVPYSAGKKFPNPIKVSSGSVDFELYVKYYFDSGCVKY